jgi:hypothetical protein
MAARKIKRKKLTLAEKNAARVRINEQRREKRRAAGGRTLEQYRAEMAAQAALTNRRRASQSGRTREQYLSDMALVKAKVNKLQCRTRETEVLPIIGYDFDTGTTDKKLVAASEKFVRLLYAERLTAIREGASQ